MSLDAQFAFLDDLPESLYQRVVTLHHGSLRTRVTGILVWRKALLRGELPPLSQLHWPDPAFAKIIRQRLAALEVVSLCRHQEPLVDQILQDICAAVASLLRRKAQGIDGLFDDILPRTNERRSGASDEDEKASTEESRDVSDDHSVNASADNDQAADARTSAAGLAAPNEADPLPSGPVNVDTANGVSDDTYERLADELERHWLQVLAHWQETSAIFQGMSSTLGRGWDLSSGDLHATGWQTFVAYRKLLRQHPQLVAIVDSMGREQMLSDDSPLDEMAVADREGGAELAPAEQWLRRESPLATSGVTRSDDIARMLPQEAAFLGHPRLKMLWHARRAEQGLMSYRYEGVMSEHQPQPLHQSEQDEQRSSPADEQRRGPLLICLDSSASMHGQPEAIAKAVCLEVLRLANETDRACHLFMFSGPGQVTDLALRFDPPGLRKILRFLSQSFHGGTDIQAPVLRALEKLRSTQWRKADMLLITDGRFPVPDSVVQAVNAARDADGLRLQGLLIGPWGSPGLSRICQPLHRFQLPSVLSSTR